MVDSRTREVGTPLGVGPGMNNTTISLPIALIALAACGGPEATRVNTFDVETNGLVYSVDAGVDDDGYRFATITDPAGVPQVGIERFADGAIRLTNFQDVDLRGDDGAVTVSFEDERAFDPNALKVLNNDVPAEFGTVEPEYAEAESELFSGPRRRAGDNNCDLENGRCVLRYCSMLCPGLCYCTNCGRSVVCRRVNRGY